MRLRLTVQRHGLPPTSILWTVPNTASPQAYTIARLLEDVNHILPLEAEHWGLEDYAVEVGGFECLHFSPVAQALKEDDHISIRPLLTAEVRSRTLTGRHQISDGGQHLIDGVPFGRPYLRHPSRPAVRIPPRKRRRLLEDLEADETSEIAGLITSNGEQSTQQYVNEVLPSGSSRSTQNASLNPRTNTKTVRFRQTQVDGTDSSDEDDEDFEPGDETEEEDVSKNRMYWANGKFWPIPDVPDSKSDSSSTSSSAPDSVLGSDSGESGSDSGSDSELESDSGSDSDSDSDSSESGRGSPPDVAPSFPVYAKLPTVNTHVPPGEGSRETHSRNFRRSRAKRLQRLKERGTLEPNATFQDLQVYEAAQDSEPTVQEPELPRSSFAAFSGKRKRLSESEETEKHKNAEGLDELERRRQDLLSKFAVESAPSEASANIPDETPTSGSGANQLNGSLSTEASAISSARPSNLDEPTDKSARKRLRPDTSAISRILVRQTRQTRAKTTNTQNQQTVDETPEIEQSPDPDFWKSRINLSAFECWNENYELSAPPFPFKQHWDPASKQMRESATKKRRKSKGMKGSSGTLPDDDDDDDDAEIKILNYEDAPANEHIESDSATAAESQLLQDVMTAVQCDLPPLPGDVSSLPPLAPGDIKEGAIIAFKLFVINPTTITPEITDYKRAIVEKEGDSGNGAGTICLKLALRDVPERERERKFDRKGNRIYGAADGFFMEEEDDDDNEDDRIWEGTFNELQEAKLLRSA